MTPPDAPESAAFWRWKSDAELLAAAQRLADYPDAVRRIIRVELDRRQLPEPPLPVLTCRACGQHVYLTASQLRCPYCGSADIT
jgi:rubrerythrin